MSDAPPDGRLDVLLIGSGGREHAIALGLRCSPLLGHFYIAPGNAGTVEDNVELDVGSNLAVVDFCMRNDVDLVIIGPEAPLVAGLADDLRLAGIACFGPSAAAARLEGSKSFARAFAARHGIPGPACQAFTEVDAALEWLDVVVGDVVVKADGLASGKGVIVPEDRVETERAIFDFLAGHKMGDAGDTIVLEERLYGEEISLFGIADGSTVVPLVTAQDHKRVGEGNTGLNTGGMGAFAPVPGITPELEAELAKQFLTTAIDGMAADGHPYVGVLYAGIMLTDEGPRLVEYNCRFGDPEAQVIVPLIESDLLDVLNSAARGELAATSIAVKPETAAAIVVAADGYPTKPREGVAIPSVEVPEGVQLIHAGTRLDAGELVSNGGRVLSVVGTGSDLAAALDKAYPVVDQLTGAGLFARSDIGWRHAPRGGRAPALAKAHEASAESGSSKTAPTKSGKASTGNSRRGNSRRGKSRAGKSRARKTGYDDAGVSLTAAAAATARISDAVRATHDERVVAGHGSFGGVFDISVLKGFDEPLLVASTDGVGTKTVLAEALDRWEGVGADIVNHGVNDVLVQGARPMFFLDTVASASLDPEVVGRVVDGMAGACIDAGCVLLGGETAEMPDVLAPGAVDISGTIVGAVERAELLPSGSVAPGHLLVGLASSGLHTNGYSLARKVFSGMDLDDALPGGKGESIGDALLAVHRSYLKPLGPALDAGLVDALAHITGGGFIDNIPRVLPPGCGAAINSSAWQRPVLFNYLIARAGLSDREAMQVLNCGIGMVAFVAPDSIDEFRGSVGEETWIIGEVTIGRDVTIA